MANRNACIIAGGMCKWGVREASYIDMVQEAAKECLDDIPGLKPKDIDGLLFASTFVGRRSVQANTAPIVADRLGLKPTTICARVDVLCAGGSTGILLAKGLVESGMSDVILVVGCEKLYTPERWQVIYGDCGNRPRLGWTARYRPSATVVCHDCQGAHETLWDKKGALGDGFRNKL